jgi:hypothetical protein
MSELVIKETGSVFDSFDTNDDRDPKDRLLYIKFTQDAQWIFGSDKEVVADNQLFVVDIAGSLAKGWQCWKNGAPVEDVSVLYADVERGEAAFIKEDELRDHSPYKGNRDGWAPTRTIRFHDLKSGGNTFQFQSSSVGARVGIEQLVKKWVEHARAVGAYEYPVVNLGSWTMKSAQGDNAAPQFDLVTWYPTIDEAIASASQGILMEKSDAA